MRVSAGYFSTLGIAPIVGRVFGPTDEVPGRDKVVVLSHALWRERFGGRREVVGTTIRLSGEPYTIVGVMPDVVFPAWPANPATVTLDADARQVWVPLPRTVALDASSSAHVFGVVARLAPGVTGSRAAELLSRLADPIAPDPHRARVTPFREQFVRDARRSLLAVAAAALCVLLIACANLAALYLSAFEARRSEFFMRAALGAGVPRLVRQLAVEALVLTGAGSAAGIALARVALVNLPEFLPPSIPFLTPTTLDLRILAFAVALAAIASVGLVAWPIRQLATSPPAPRGMLVPPRLTVYRSLVVAQMAISVGVIVVAGLLTQSLRAVRHQDPGFRLTNVLVARLGLPLSPRPAPGEVAAAADPRARGGSVDARRSRCRRGVRSPARSELEREPDCRWRGQAVGGAAGGRVADREPGVFRRARRRCHSRPRVERSRRPRCPRRGDRQRGVRTRARRTRRGPHAPHRDTAVPGPARACRTSSQSWGSSPTSGSVAWSSRRSPRST